MDSKRAKEIMASKDTIEVLYQGSPVWIENVGMDNLAEVKYLESQEKVKVPVYKLVENNPLQ